MLDHSTARKLLRYDPRTGTLRWKVARSGVRAGAVAGWVDATTKNRQIRILGRSYLAHQIVWLLHTGVFPTFEINHKNGNRDDNSWSNLRPTNRQCIGANRGKNRNNTSGFKGVVRWPDGRWRAQIGKNRRSIHLGLFETIEEARAAYIRAAIKLFGEFAGAQ
jgi:hypothetical protein